MVNQSPGLYSYAQNMKRAIDEGVKAKTEAEEKAKAKTEADAKAEAAPTEITKTETEEKAKTETEEKAKAEKEANDTPPIKPTPLVTSPLVKADSIAINYTYLVMIIGTFVIYLVFLIWYCSKNTVDKVTMIIGMIIIIPIYLVMIYKYIIYI